MMAADYWFYISGLLVGSNFCFFKQKTAYELRISDWSSDVCASDLRERACLEFEDGKGVTCNRGEHGAAVWACRGVQCAIVNFGCRRAELRPRVAIDTSQYIPRDQTVDRSEEHTSELQSLMRISYAVFCLKKKIIYYHIIFISIDFF